MLTLNDGRSELWQWDTGRKMTVDAECSQVHFSNKVFGRSIDVDVIDGVAIIPDILLQTDKDLNVWAFVGTAENGYTKISKTFKVNRRNKPSDYVFTPPEQTTLSEIMKRIYDLEAIQDPDAIKNAVDDYLANNPIKVNETDPTVPDWAKNPTPPDVKIPDKLPNPYSITFTGAVNASYDGSSAVEIKIPDSGGNVDQSGLSATEKKLMLTLFKNAGYADDSMLDTYNELATLWGGETVEPEEPDEPVVPDEPDTPEKTLTGISAVYSGGDVAVGTALTDLTGIVVTAHYSDGTSETVTGYTLSGTIAEGSNTITVTYQDKTTMFAVTGTATDTYMEITVKDFLGVVTRTVYADDGTTVLKDSTASWACYSEETFDTDTKVKFIVTPGWNGTRSNEIYLGSTDNVGSLNGNAVVFYAEALGEGAYTGGVAYEKILTIKADMQAIAIYPTGVSVTVAMKKEVIS